MHPFCAFYAVLSLRIIRSRFFSIQCGTSLPKFISFSLTLPKLLFEYGSTFSVKKPKQSWKLNNTVGLMSNSCQNSHLSIQSVICCKIHFCHLHCHLLILFIILFSSATWFTFFFNNIRHSENGSFSLIFQN